MLILNWEGVDIWPQIRPRKIPDLLAAEERAGCFTLIVFLMSCDCSCSVSLPHNAVGWAVVYDCDVLWSYLLLVILCYFSRKHGKVAMMKMEPQEVGKVVIQIAAAQVMRM